MIKREGAYKVGNRALDAQVNTALFVQAQNQNNVAPVKQTQTQDRYTELKERIIKRGWHALDAEEKMEYKELKAAIDESKNSITVDISEDDD